MLKKIIFNVRKIFNDPVPDQVQVLKSVERFLEQNPLTTITSSNTEEIDTIVKNYVKNFISTLKV